MASLHRGHVPRKSIAKGFFSICFYDYVEGARCSTIFLAKMQLFASTANSKKRGLCFLINMKSLFVFIRGRHYADSDGRVGCVQRRLGARYACRFRMFVVVSEDTFPYAISRKFSVVK